MNTASAVSAASCRPSSEAPAWTITGQPCTGRAMLSGTAHLQIFALVVEHMHFRRIEIEPLLDIARKGVVGEGIPQARDHVEELARPLVALGMIHVIVEAEIQRGIGVRGGDDVPSRPAAGDVVERGKAAGDVIGRVEGGRARRDQADALGRARQRRQQRERLERGHGVAAFQRIDRHVEHGQVIGHEERVELAGLEFLDHRLQVREIEIGVRPGPGIAPRAGVQADRPHERAEFQLTWCHGRIPKGLCSSEKIGIEARGAPSEDYFVFAGSLNIVIARSDSDEAIHLAAVEDMDCFASLAMTMGTRDYCPFALWSNALSTASVIAVTPVWMVGFGTGANSGEWLPGSGGPPLRAAATRSGS